MYMAQNACILVSAGSAALVLLLDSPASRGSSEQASVAWTRMNIPMLSKPNLIPTLALHQQRRELADLHISVLPHAHLARALTPCDCSTQKGRAFAGAGTAQGAGDGGRRLLQHWQHGGHLIRGKGLDKDHHSRGHSSTQQTQCRRVDGGRVEGPCAATGTYCTVL
jgi:hypothetical protein